MRFSFANAHVFGDVLPRSMRLRHKIFIEEQHYSVPSYNGLEYDEYDTPAAQYLFSDPYGIARVVPTTRPYMLSELWPQLTTRHLPSSKSIWEVSRFGVAYCSPSDKNKALAELFSDLTALALEYEIEGYLFVSNRRLIQHLLGPLVPVQPLGPIHEVGGFTVSACYVPLNAAAFKAVQEKYRRL